jgi:hypothetical protein
MKVFLEALAGGLVGGGIATAVMFTYLEWRATEKIGEFENVVDLDRHRAG